MRKEEQRKEDIILTQGSTLSGKKKKNLVGICSNSGFQTG